MPFSASTRPIFQFNVVYWDKTLTLNKDQWIQRIRFPGNCVGSEWTTIVAIHKNPFNQRQSRIRIVTLDKNQCMVTVIKKGTPKEEIKMRVNEIVSKSPKKDILRYAGKLKTDIDPLEYQRKMRNEWK